MGDLIYKYNMTDVLFTSGSRDRIRGIRDDGKQCNFSSGDFRDEDGKVKEWITSGEVRILSGLDGACKALASTM